LGEEKIECVAMSWVASRQWPVSNDTLLGEPRVFSHDVQCGLGLGPSQPPECPDHSLSVLSLPGATDEEKAGSPPVAKVNRYSGGIVVGANPEANHFHSIWMDVDIRDHG
jgi:hypothetical protein